LVISPGGSITMAFNGNVYGKGASFQWLCDIYAIGTGALAIFWL
jgi:hypothetical protein